MSAYKQCIEIKIFQLYEVDFWEELKMVKRIIFIFIVLVTTQVDF